MRKLTFYIALTTIFFIGCSSEQDSQNHDSVTVASMPVDTDTLNALDTLNKETLLIPGVSAGNIKINEDAESVYKILGKPDSGDAAMQKAVAIWYEKHDPKSFTTAIYTVRDTGDNPPARIKQIRVTSPEFKTQSGIGVHSTLADIQGTFTIRQLTGTPDDSKAFQIFDSPAGIAFELDKNLKVTAVLIHPADEELKANYLPLR
ncbi:MAG TPA: hypothetical protein VK541_16430 [Pedobacter sp.]|uniref:hypothetical protein n=1 Tax=Pedobacter sp. TaxID=1411316 RepID=UPI002CD4FB5C|nr:hypothetical protein [Pedobacter sp.]HMI04075.1 hypothetical protein [Pedobacter sp.]